ncbi:transcriptional regulator [Tersicoccus solisilvae]|uniref:Transcriptional regulator n=1 Tax=Tersicoccus solisilvae TaxID=1882339 RepID=A0ABQ1PML2_9MICC|nr:LysR family transcriptional regulator [Tersicoccus solisilvae]GGC99477.1 transcriptional regulator [Tersicoccus solisilvae]
MLPSLRDLELFVAVVDEGSITAGALAVGLSLSSASTRITALEKTHGGLLRRQRAGVVTTPAGDLLTTHARRVLAEAHDLDRQMSAHRHGLRHEIRLASNTSAVDTLTEFLASSLARLPDIRVVLSETSSRAAIQDVVNGAVDMAVVSAFPEQAGLVARDLWPDPLVIIQTSRARSRGARAGGRATFREVVQGPMIGLTEGSPLQEQIDQQARLLGVVPSYRVRLPTLSAVLAVATTGAGAAIIPQGAARRLKAARQSVHPMSEPWTQRQALLVTTKNAHEHGVARAFTDALLRYGRELPGWTTAPGRHL